MTVTETVRKLPDDVEVQEEGPGAVEEAPGSGSGPFVLLGMIEITKSSFVYRLMIRINY